MDCVCSKIPPNIRIIKVGETEVGLVDLPRTFRDVYFLRIENEPALKKKLLEKVKEKNQIPKEREELYAEALLREYFIYIKARFPLNKATHQPVARKPKRFFLFLKMLFRRKRQRK